MVGPFYQDEKCKLCGKRFVSRFCQKLHENVHKVNGLKCEKSMKRCFLCNKTFEKDNVYKFHKQNFHRKPGADDIATTVVFPTWYVKRKSSKIEDLIVRDHKLNGRVMKKKREKTVKELTGTVLRVPFRFVFIIIFYQKVSILHCSRALLCHEIS